LSAEKRCPRAGQRFEVAGQLLACARCAGLIIVTDREVKLAEPVTGMLSLPRKGLGVDFNCPLTDPTELERLG